MKKIYLYTMPIIGIFAFASMNVDAATDSLREHSKGQVSVAEQANVKNSVSEQNSLAAAEPDALDGTMAMNDDEDVAPPVSEQAKIKTPKASQKSKHKATMIKTAMVKGSSQSNKSDASNP